MSSERQRKHDGDSPAAYDGGMRLAVSQDELVGLGTLLGEHTAKLESLCDARTRTQTRQLILGAVVAVFGLASFVTFMLRTPRDEFSMTPHEPSSTLTIAALVLAGLFLVTGAVLFIDWAQSRRLKYKARHAALLQLKLMRLLSQYHEHSQYGPRWPHELEFRLSAAEATLDYYQRVFRQGLQERAMDHSGLTAP